MAFHDPQLKSMTFQDWKMKLQNSMTHTYPERTREGRRGEGRGGENIIVPA